MIKKILSIVLLIVVACVALFGLQYAGLVNLKFFGPRFENVRREIFEETRSYNQAKLQELAKYRLEYVRSKDPDEREALASAIRHRFADYDRNRLPRELAKFLEELNQ